MKIPNMVDRLEYMREVAKEVYNRPKVQWLSNIKIEPSEEDSKYGSKYD